MRTEPELLNERLDRLALVLDEIMPNCANLVRDALELLKEQEAVKPRRIDGKRNHFIKCGNCNDDLMTGYKFCPNCGKAVKWNE